MVSHSIMRICWRPILALLAGVALISVTYRFSREWLMVDRCLSALHGSFDYSNMSCDLQTNHPYILYQLRHPRDEWIALVALISLALALSGYFYSRTNHKRSDSMQPDTTSR
jgi:hypothetical protein